MSTVRTVAKNTTALMLARVFSLVCGVVVAGFIARSIGTANYGKLGFAQALVGLLIIFADIGLKTVTIREVARYKELASKYLGNIFFIKLILSVFALALIVGVVNLMHKPMDVRMIVYLVGIYAIFDSFSFFMQSIFKAFEKMEYVSFLNIGQSIITTIAILVILYLGYGLMAIVLVHFFVSLIILLTSFVITVKRFTVPELKIDLQFWRKVTSLAFPFLCTSSIGMVYQQIDVVMLSAMQGDAPVGWYSAAGKLIYTLIFIPETFSSALFPVMSRLFLSSEKSLLSASEKSAKYLFMIGLPISVGAILLADRIILLIYGKNFTQSILAMQILALYLPLRFVNHITGFTLSSINKEPLRALSAMIAALTSVILNFLLIPKYSYIGSAMATAITETVLFTLYYYFVAKNLSRLKLAPICLKPILACMVMGISIYYLKGLNLALLIFSGALIYLAALYLVRGFDSIDKAIFRNLLEGGSLRQQPISK